MRAVQRPRRPLVLACCRALSVLRRAVLLPHPLVARCRAQAAGASSSWTYATLDRLRLESGVPAYRPAAPSVPPTVAWQRRTSRQPGSVPLASAFGTRLLGAADTDAAHSAPAPSRTGSAASGP